MGCDDGEAFAREARTLAASIALSSHHQRRTLRREDGRVPLFAHPQQDLDLQLGRLLNARERCRLQGINPDDFKQVVPDAQWRKQLGNAMRVNVLERLLARLLPAVGLTGPLPDRWASGTAAAELEATRA